MNHKIALRMKSNQKFCLNNKFIYFRTILLSFGAFKHASIQLGNETLGLLGLCISTKWHTGSVQQLQKD